jgi:arsenate reductase
VAEQTGGIVIYHNPDCGTSRNTLALMRAAGIAPQVIEYLKTLPSPETIAGFASAIGLPLRALLRRKGTPYAALGLDDPALTDAQLLDAVAAHPILLNRPIVVTHRGVRLCRPSEVVLDLLPQIPHGDLRKEEGVPFIRDHTLPGDDAGLRTALAAEGLPSDDLPTDDLAEPGRCFYAYASLAGEALGYGGFELYGGDALIRSIVVPAAARSCGIGRNLVALLLYRAYEAGARRAYLLTNSAAPFFTRLGFSPIARDAAPAAIRATRQAATLCPASATLMARDLEF